MSNADDDCTVAEMNPAAPIAFDITCSVLLKLPLSTKLARWAFNKLYNCVVLMF